MNERMQRARQRLAEHGVEMTPQQFAEKRDAILEQVRRHLEVVTGDSYTEERIEQILKLAFALENEAKHMLLEFLEEHKEVPVAKAAEVLAESHAEFCMLEEHVHAAARLLVKEGVATLQDGILRKVQA